MRPDGDGHYLVGGRGSRPDEELATPQTAQRGADDSALAEFARELVWRLPPMEGGIWRGSWSSFYDFTPDENPVVDRVPGHERLIVAAGGSGHAFKLAPALGLGAAELLCDGEVRSFDWSVARVRALRVRVSGIVLAAGAGTRFRAAGGGSKLLAPVEGRPLVERPLRAMLAAGLDEVVVVLGSGADEVREHTDLGGARALVHRAGRRHGVVAGRRARDPAGRLRGCCRGARRRARAPAEAVQRVASRIAVGDAPLVGARYAGGRAHPVAIHRSLWSRLPTDRGGRCARARDRARRRGLHRPRPPRRCGYSNT